MSSIKTTQIDGDVSVGRNVAVGGKTDIAGSVSIGHNLKVKGWLEAPNIKGVNKGVYARESSLLSAYPSPQAGWFAGVGETSPFALYMVEDGAWYATGGVWTPDVRVSLSEEEYATMLSTLSGKVDKEDGKGLSTNDYTNEDKTKLAGLQNYDDSSITGKVTTLATSVSLLGTRVVSLEAREGKLAARVLAHHHGVPETPGTWVTDEDTTTYNYYHTDLLALPNGVYTIGETGWAKVFKYLDGTLVAMEELTLPYSITVTSLTVVGEQPFDAIRVMRRVPIDVAVPTDGMPVYVTGVDYNILDFFVSVIATHPQIRALLSGKQDAISDLAAIRSGARSGASAYQRPDGGIPIEDLTTEAQNTIAGKVDKVTGKGLSTNDYTDADKTKLSGLSNYDDSEVRQMIAATNAHFASYYTKAESYSAADLDLMFKEKQNKETGKGLSTNDYTTADKSKLAGISAGAQVNVIESIRVNGIAAVVTNKAASVTLPNATTSAAGLMSDEDKTKLAGLVGLPVCEGVTAANFFGYGGDCDATFCSLRVRWNHDYELDMEDIMLGIDEDVENGFKLTLLTDDSSVIASHRNELKVSFDLPSESAAYSGDFAEMSVKICDDNGREIEELLMSDELKVKPGYHYTLLLSQENGRLILDHKRYKLPEV